MEILKQSTSSLEMCMTRVNVLSYIWVVFWNLNPSDWNSLKTCEMFSTAGQCFCLALLSCHIKTQRAFLMRSFPTSNGWFQVCVCVWGNEAGGSNTNKVIKCYTAYELPHQSAVAPTLPHHHSAAVTLPLPVPCGYIWISGITQASHVGEKCGNVELSRGQASGRRADKFSSRQKNSDELLSGLLIFGRTPHSGT